MNTVIGNVYRIGVKTNQYGKEYYRMSIRDAEGNKFHGNATRAFIKDVYASSTWAPTIGPRVLGKQVAVTAKFDGDRFIRPTQIVFT